LITSAAEAKKPISKRAIKHATAQVRSDVPWSTLEAQLLVKISNTLHPKKIDFKNYEALFHIPRILSKPGIVLANETDYKILLQHVGTIKKPDPIVNVDITERGASAVEKENVEPEKDLEEAPEEVPKKKKKKSVRSHLLSYQLCTLFHPPLGPYHSSRKRSQKQTYSSFT